MEIKIKENKTTEFGLIPSDWQMKEFQDVMTGFFSGATPYRGRPEYYKGQINWITSGELNYNIITDTIEKITEEAVRNTNLKILPKGTFLFAITGLEAEGTRGSCALTGIDATTNQSCMALFPFESLDVKYLYHYYVWKGKMLALRYCQGTKQQSYTGKIARKLPIILPPTKSEQTAIATALSDTDALIENLEKLIAKKRNIKQGVMQELLTGRKRLAGFNGEWMKIKLGDICDIRKGQLITEKTAAGGEFPVIAGGINPSYFHNRPNRGKNTITISASGANAGYVSFHRNPIFASDCSTIEEKGTFNIVYIFFLLQLFQKKIFKLQTGGAQPHVYPEHLKPLELVFPQEVTEQDAIANILIDIDEELSGLEKQMNKYQLIKQGMMQTLLTGKIRLV